MKTLSKNIWFVAMSLTLLLIPRTFNAKDIKQALNLNEAMKGKSYSQYFTALREGEFLIDTNVVYVPPPYNQCVSSIAFDGTNYFVVWADGRNRSSYIDIYGARVDQSGAVLDSAGIAISAAVNWQYSPSVAFDGTNFLVVWQDERNDPASPDIYGARVNQSGIVIDTSGIAISTAVNDQGIPSVAFDGNNYLVVWQDARSDVWDDIYGARVSQSGVVLDPTGIAISTGEGAQRYPSIAFDGTNYLVVWRGSGIYGARVNQSGIVIDTVGIAVSTYGDCPSVAFDGTNYLIVWQDNRSGSYTDIYGARLSQLGVVLDSAGIAVSTAVDHQRHPSITFDGGNYLVVWADRRNDPCDDIYGARVNQSGVILDPAGIAITTGVNWQLYPSVAFGDTNYLAIWSVIPNGSSDLYGARLNQSGVVLDPESIPISTAANWQLYPSVAFGDTSYLIVWQDERNYLESSFDIYGTRINQTGMMLDSLAIAVSTMVGWQLYPSVAFDGTNYLVVWQDYRSSSYADIYGARVDQSGAVLDPTGIAISTAAYHQQYPSVAFDGTNYLIVWQDNRNGSYTDIYGARLSQSGVVLDPGGIAISTDTDTSNQCNPSVAFDGTNYLVVWQDYRSSSYADIYGARVNQSGIVLDTAGIAISTAANWQWYPSVAFDGTNYLIVWIDERNYPAWLAIYGARVNQSGVVIDSEGIAISTIADWRYYPSVAFDDTDYLVVWEDYCSGSEWDIYGAKVNTSAVVIDSFAISLQSGDQNSPTVAHGQSGQLLITYSGWTDSINIHPANAMRIWGKFLQATAISEDVGFRIHVTGFSLHIYPNPVHKECEIKYILPEKTNVYISMFDVAGRLIKKSVYKNQNAGFYRKRFNVIDLPQGVYFIRFNTEENSEIKKIILIK